MKKIRRTIALVLSIVMILSLVPTTFALDATNFSIVSATVDGSVGGTATVTFVADQAVTIEYVDGLFGKYAVLDASNQLEVASFSDPGGGNSYSAIDSNGDVNIVYSTPAGGLAIAAGDPICSATYTVPAGTAPGEYQVTLDFEDPGILSTHSGDFNNVFTGTIIVTAPATAPAFELYYELDVNTDEDNDKYMDYAAGATVTANIYAKAAAATNLQAFDLYVTNDALLVYDSYTSTYGTRVGSTAGDGQASNETLQHIQFKFEEGAHPDIAISSNPVVLATITFTISGDAVYSNDAINDGWMPITITTDSNLATERNEQSINTDRDDEYKLTISDPVLGAEVVTTYTVTYDPNTTETVSGMPDPLYVTKYHNRTLTITDATPTRENYSFLGWSETEGDNNTVDYESGDDYTKNETKTLYAVWQRNLYTVKWYNLNNPTESQLLETDNNVPSGTAPSYDGEEPVKAATVDHVYTFIGWHTESSSTTALSSLPNVTEDTEYYAIFSEEDRTYTVTWLDQDESPLSTSTIVYDNPPAYQNGFEQPTKPEDDGHTYTFSGWATSANQDSGTPLANLPNVIADITYYAAYQPTNKTFDVTLVPNGGTINSDDVTSYDYSVGATLPTDVTKEGYTFEGWYTGWDTENNVVSGTKVTAIGTDEYGPKTFYANWTENTYSVQYVPGNDATGTAYTDSGIAYTQPYTIKAWDSAEVNFTAPEGFVFAGWSASNGENYVTGDSYTGMSATANDVIVLTATWAQDVYNITYVFTDGTDTLSGVTNGNAVTYSKAAGLTLTDPSKTGYTFQSWSAVYTTGGAAIELANGNEIPAGTEGDITITGTFSKDEYTITYSANGGSVTPATQTYTITSTDALAIPTRDGYDFAGWKNEGESVGSWDAGETTNVAGQNLNNDWGDVTLTAQWTATPYTITFDVDGTTSEASYKTTDDSNIASLKSNPAKDYYTFSGWTPDGAGNWGTTPIAAADTATTKVTEKYGNVTLTAGWTAIEYTITFYHDPEGTDPNTVLDTQTFTADDTSITIPDVPAKDGYTGEWSIDYSTTDPDPAEGSKEVYPVYSAISYTITYDANGGTVTTTTQEYTIESTDALATPSRNGYTFTGWKVTSDTEGSWTKDVVKATNYTLSSDWGNVTLTAQWTATTYHITFVTDGTAIPVMDYTIEDTDTLPASSGNGLYSFTNWKLTAATDPHNWGELGTIFTTENKVEGHFGDITLTAEWELSFKYDIDEYKYAYSGWKMLRIDATGLADGTIYTFNGAAMYYTTDQFYLIDSTDSGVYYTLIAPDYIATGDDGFNLTKIGEGLVGTSTDAAATLYGSGEIEGDINGDGKLNIADANIIHQMVERGGNYYSTAQLSIQQRLRCDMDTDNTGTNCQYRGSINDTNKIVNLINKIQ